MSSARATAEAKTRSLRLGLDAEPHLRELARRIAHDLGEELGRRFPEIDWSIEVGDGDPMDPQARIAELVNVVRQAMLDRGWDLAICITDIPLRSDGRPLTAHASPTEGVALISVPALGPVDVEERLRNAAVDVIDALVGQDAAGEDEEDDDGERRERVAERLTELASPLGTVQVTDDDTIRFSGAVIMGNLRLLGGMVRANRPWQVVVRLSRALVAALGTAAYVCASTGFWTLADHMTWPRLLGLALGGLLLTTTAMLVAHGLWERSTRPQTRERVILFNAVTTLTVFFGVLTLYLGLLAFSVVAVFSLLPQGALEAQLEHEPITHDYLNLAWLAASLATLAGALGSLVDGKIAVREAAYGYRPSRAGSGDDGRGD